MSMAYIPSSYELNQYLDRARQEDGAKTIRKLTADELEAIHELGKQYKEFNRVIMELLVIINVLTRLRQTELYYIVANARRIIQSLARQRNKGYVIKKALAIVKPKDDVMPEIRRFIAVSRRRMDYIRQTIIPENLDLTPIKEYVKLIGAESFASAVYERFSEPRKSSAIMTTRDWSTLSFSERIIAPISDSIQRFFMKLAPRTIFKTIERHIILAGKQNVWDVNKAVLVWGLTIFAFFAVGLVIFFATKMLLIQRVTILLVLTAIGVMVPISYVKSIIRERQEKIVTELPPFLDLLSVSVQAGLSFDAAVDRILRHSTGALMDEFRQMQKDLRLGLSKKEALHPLVLVL